MKKILTALMILTASSLFAQQEALFSQYMFNKLAINPGYAGSRDLLTADVIYRYQWVDIDGAPKTLNASINSPLTNPHLALGFSVSNDQIGPMSYTSAMATFAYRIIFPKSKLSFGISAGAKNNGITMDDFNAYNTDDPFLVSSLEKKVVPDANFGIYYYSDKFYVGLSSQQLLRNQTLVVDEAGSESQYSKLLTHFYLMSGVAIPLSEKIVFRPSMLAKFVQNAPPQLDLNASFLFVNTLWLGVSYRTEGAISFITEVNVNQNLRIGYSYDVWLNELKVYNKGSHEIRFSCDFNVFKRILSPRYF
jgi:type IX secretion system PorP/SprF family membrane protein